MYLNIVQIYCSDYRKISSLLSFFILYCRPSALCVILFYRTLYKTFRPRQKGAIHFAWLIQVPMGPLCSLVCLVASTCWWVQVTFRECIYITVQCDWTCVTIIHYSIYKTNSVMSPLGSFLQGWTHHFWCCPYQVNLQCQLQKCNLKSKSALLKVLDSFSLQYYFVTY